MNKKTRSRNKKTIRKNVRHRGGMYTPMMNPLSKSSKPFNFNFNFNTDFPKTKAFLKKMFGGPEYRVKEDDCNEVMEDMKYGRALQDDIDRCYGRGYDHGAKKNKSKKKKKTKKKPKKKPKKHKKSKDGKSRSR